jgi:pyridoxamine 5'-phosphate oxidase
VADVGIPSGVHTDPLQQFAEWWDEDHVPVVVATAGADGRPTARAVVLEGFDDRGFVFWSSYDIPKGRALAEDPRVALVFLWKGRQARVEGRAEPVSDEENAHHWEERRGKRQLAAFHQSEPVANREELNRLLETVPDDPPRPAFWVGYRVVPDRFDLWSEDDDFVHDRFSYERSPHGWTQQRLQP